MRTAAAVLVWLAASAASGGEAPKETVVLDLGRGSFRAFAGWKTPVLVAPDGKLKPLLELKRKDQKEEDRKPVPVRASDRPAANWTAPDFDDSGWPRTEGAVALNTSPFGSCRGPFAEGRYSPNNPLEGNLVCLRGKFRVSDPTQVKDLKLVLRYYGGAVVYVNGAELCRGHLPEGQLGPEVLSTRYADEAYVTPDGKTRPGMNEDAKVMAELTKVRGRELPARGLPDGVSIPGAMLRKGVNVLAVEVRAAPVSELSVEGTVGSVTWSGERRPWPHAMAFEARMTSLSGNGLIANAGPPQGIEIANCQPIETIYASDYINPSEGGQIFPIRMIGARNGTFSGKVLLSSAGAIKNLRASASELVQAGGKGKIPAANVQARWAERTTPKVSWETHWDPLGWIYFDRLLGNFPAEIPVAKLLGDRRQLAVVPIWVTVRVPADAPAGEYQGTFTVEAEGAVPVKHTVPVHLKVNDWRLPDPKDFVTHQNIYQSPDSVAKWCNVPLWSDKHFELMGKSLKAFQEVGNKMCLLHLTVNARSLGNSESMVRWVKKPDGAFDYDFTIAEKYLDLYEKTCGKPAILRLEAWQRALDPKTAPVLCVSVLDPATGKIEPMPQPAYGTPENEAFWRPVFTELRKRLEKRGWYDVAAVNWIDYSAGAYPPIVDVYKRLWPDGKWMQTSHTNPNVFQGTAKDGSGAMPVPYTEYVWGAGSLYNPDAGGQYPRAWKAGAKRIETGFPRYGVQFILALNDTSKLTAYRLVTEAAQQGNLRGLGYLGGDFWPVPIKDGRVASVSYGFVGVAMTDAVQTCFSPSPEGAIYNERMEMFREGVQVAEAIIFLQRALEAKQVPDDLARKIGETLDERARYYLRAQEILRAGTCWRAFECSNWQEHDDKLFALCAEVAAKTGAK